MKTLAAALLLALLFVAPPVGGEEKEEDARPRTVTARVLRLEVDALPGLGLIMEEWSVPSEAAARPLPSELTTPPVTKMNFMVWS